MIYSFKEEGEGQISADRVTRTVKRKDGEYKQRGKRGTKRMRERERDCGAMSAKRTKAGGVREREKCVCEGHTVASRSEDSRCPAARLLASCAGRRVHPHIPFLPPFVCAPLFASRVPPLLPHSNIDSEKKIMCVSFIRFFI